MGHPIVTLFETNDKSMDIFDFVLQDIDKTFDSSFFFNQVVSKTRSVDDSDSGFGRISQKSALIMARFFGYWSLIVMKAIDFETTMLEADSGKIFVPA